MKTATKLAAAAVLSIGASMLASTSASAAIVCNRERECWHVKEAYAYHPEWGVTVHPDDWRWERHEHYVWREHEGRGYWHGGVWIPF